MQTTRSQSQQTDQEIISSYAASSTSIFSHSLTHDNKFRFWLSFLVFYPFALFLTLFVGVFLRHVPATSRGILNAAAVLLVTSILLVVSYRWVSLILQERVRMLRELSRTRRLAEISYILNGTIAATKEKIRQVGRALADEGERDGWRCRIVVHEDESFLPPSGGNLGFHVPMVVDEKTVGTLIVMTGRSRLDSIDQEFFNSLASILGLFITKEKLWDDFHSLVEQIEASLLLHTETAPLGSETDQTTVADHRTVEQMLSMLGLLQGKTAVPKPRY